MDSASQRTSDGPAAGTEPDLRAEAPRAKAVQVWAFLCPNPMCNTELIIFPEQTGQWVECPSCGLQLRAPEVIPGKDDPPYVPQRVVPRRQARMSADEAAWLAIEDAGSKSLAVKPHGWAGPVPGKTAARAEPTPLADHPGAAARDALAREVARASAARAEPESVSPERAAPERAAPEVTRAADALDSLARGSHEGAGTPPGARKEPPAPPAPQAPSELRFREESEPLPESTVRETLPVPLERAPMAEPVVREKPVLRAEAVVRPTLPGGRGPAGRPNAPYPDRRVRGEIGSPDDTRAGSPDLPAPVWGSPGRRPARTFRSDLLVVWMIAVLVAAGVGFLAWLTGLPDLAAGSILAIGVALLWTFFGRGSDKAAPPAGPSW